MLRYDIQCLNHFSTQNTLYIFWNIQIDLSHEAQTRFSHVYTQNCSNIFFSNNSIQHKQISIVISMRQWHCKQSSFTDKAHLTKKIPFFKRTRIEREKKCFQCDAASNVIHNRNALWLECVFALITAFCIATGNWIPNETSENYEQLLSTNTGIYMECRATSPHGMDTIFYEQSWENNRRNVIVENAFVSTGTGTRERKGEKERERWKGEV